MANNKDLRDGQGNLFTTKTTETGGVNVSHVNVDNFPATQPVSGTVNVGNFPASTEISNDAGNPIPVSNASLTNLDTKTPSTITTTPSQDVAAPPTRLVGEEVVTAGFSAVGSSVLDTFFNAPIVGTGVNANQLYYVTSVGSATTFNFAAAPGGSNVVPSVAYTGTSMYRVFDQIRLQTTAGERTFTYNQPLRGIANTITNFLIPTSLTSGNIFITVNGYRGF